MPIRGKKLLPSSFATMQIFVDDYSNSILKGRIYHLASRKLMSFLGIYDFLNKLEGVYNKFSFPQATHEFRTFRKSSFPVSDMGNTAENYEDMEVKTKVKKEKEVKIEPSAKGTFIIRVLYRQNATWQGNIQWVEGKKAQNFRSDLEMLKLMDDALRTNDEENDEVKWE